MLEKLAIHNYAIIDHLEVLPGEGLNIVTGETGAGKSIILGALSLILGDRADTSVLINKEDKCVVEAVFNVKNNKTFSAALAVEDIDSDDQCIIRREISTGGKSRAFINDTPVRLDTLNRLTSLLVDLHQQFDHLSLEDSTFMMDVLDAVSGITAEKNQYAALYNEYKTTSRSLEELRLKKSSWQKEADYKQYLLNELSQASFKPNEIEEADAQLKQMSHAERITQTLQDCLQKLEESEQPVNNELKRIAQQLESITALLPQAKDIATRVNSVYIELKDIATEIEEAAGTVRFDEEQVARLQERVDTGYKLLKKHAVTITAELLDIQLQLQSDLQESIDVDDAINVLIAKETVVLERLISVAKKMSAARQKESVVFAKNINKLLALVGMPNAVFSIAVGQRTQPGELGMDNVQFYLDANKSGKLQPVFKAASGGEMNRIMLCIKSLTAKAMELPTLIFDEVDTGISGEAARQVGILLKELTQYHQVICITHQPQVAARGSRHMFVYKQPAGDGRITTRVSWLDNEERVLAIARMIGGEKPGQAALQNARELLAV